MRPRKGIGNGGLSQSHQQCSNRCASNGTHFVPALSDGALVVRRKHSALLSCRRELLQRADRHVNRRRVSS